ncbi:MAG: hypothetical protein L0H31_12780 [Nocardioidaceae bacterium]|nr:hypothetical protein [Nocardioidaceae bacterium]
MRAIKNVSIPITAADQAFQAALGVVQNTKNLDVLAVHNQARKLVAFERSKMSNPKIHVLAVDQSPQPALHLAVGTDPRTRKALLDGHANEKSATKFIQALHGALDGTAPAPATPVANHYVQKKNQVAWDDPDVEPDIELGFSWLGLASQIR